MSHIGATTPFFRIAAKNPGLILFLMQPPKVQKMVQKQQQRSKIKGAKYC